MHKKILFYLTIIVTCSCSKIKIEEPAPEPKAETAEFIVDKEVLYMNESLAVTVKDSSSNSANYYYEFGDGNKLSGKYSTTHHYSKAGKYKISLKVDDKTYSKDILVKPGFLSYQIKNSSSTSLDILSYIDNPRTGTLLRDDYAPGKISDTLYISYTESNKYLFSASLFHNNREYVVKTENGESIWFEKYKHNIYNITDSTKLAPKSSSGSENDTTKYVIDFR